MEDTQNHCLAFVRVDDPMRDMAVEVQAIAYLQRDCLVIKFEIDRSLLDHQELFTFVRQRRVSSNTWRHR